MKKISLLSLITLFTLVFTLQSCGGGGGDNPVTPTPTEDTTPPVIANLKPAANSTIVFNNPIIVTADVADNVALASYTIEISNTLTRSIQNIPFSAVIDGTISGKEDKINRSIDLPLYASDGTSKYKNGDYYVILTVFDKAGNKSVTSNNIKLAYP